MAGLNRFYYPTKFKSRSEALANGVKCFFISYQKKDKESAEKVADYIQNTGIDVYIDLYDKDLKISHQSNNPKEVTKAICNGINNSSHMIVIVSPNTMNSSWVPFEIGYGYDKTELRVLCLKGIGRGSLPEYVKIVPIIRDIYDLNGLIETYSGDLKETLIKKSLMKSYNDSYNPLSKIMDSLITD